MAEPVDLGPDVVRANCPEMQRAFGLEGVYDPDVSKCPADCMTPGGVEVPRFRYSPLRFLLGDTVQVCGRNIANSQEVTQESSHDY